jgi:hypothetical protein
MGQLVCRYTWESQMERVRAAEAALERAAYDHRQRLAAEHDKLREAKEGAHREESARALMRAREEEVTARREADIAAKESAWQVRYAEMAAEAEERAMGRRRESEREAERRIEALMSELGTVADERAKLEADRSHHAAELAAIAKERHRATAAERRAAAEEDRSREHAAAAEMLGMQLEDLRLQLDAARNALEKRGIPLPVAARASELPGGGGGIGLALLMGERAAAGSPTGGPAYAQVVAAMERARAESAVARQEIVRRRKDIARLSKERKREARERGEALREAAEWKGKSDVANQMLDEACKKVEEAWATAEQAKGAMHDMKVLLDEERGKRVIAEQSSEVFRAAATATYAAVGVSASGLGLDTSLNNTYDSSATRQRALDATTAGMTGAVIGGPMAHRNTGSVPPRAGQQQAGQQDVMPTATRMRLEKLAAQEETQRAALANFQRRVAFERQSHEAAAAMAAANLDAMQRTAAARRNALASSSKFHAREYFGSTGLSSHIGVTGGSYDSGDSDEDDDVLAAEVKASIDAQLGLAPSTYGAAAGVMPAPAAPVPNMVRASVDGREVLVPANTILAWGEASSSSTAAAAPAAHYPAAVAAVAVDAAAAAASYGTRQPVVVASGRAAAPVAAPAPARAPAPAPVAAPAATAVTAGPPSPTASPSSSNPSSPTKGSFFGRIFSSKKAAGMLSPVKQAAVSAAEEKAAAASAAVDQKLREAEERRAAAESAAASAANAGAARDRAAREEAERRRAAEVEAAARKSAAAAQAEAQRRAEEEQRMKATAAGRQQADMMAALEAERKKREDMTAKMAAAARGEFQPAPASAPAPASTSTPPRSPIAGPSRVSSGSRGTPSRAPPSPGVSASGEIEEFVEEEEDYAPDDLELDDVGFDDDVSVAGNSEIQEESFSVKSGEGSGDSVF